MKILIISVITALIVGAGLVGLCEVSKQHLINTAAERGIELNQL